MRRLKKPVAVVILLAGASISQLPAQSVPPDPALQQPASGRASYDPMARGKSSSGQPKGIVETTLAGVNPHNTDYGAVVEDWRKEIFENTLHKFYFWALIGMTAVLGTSLMANGWLLRDRERRLAITADIVAQLYNAYVTARVAIQLLSDRLKQRACRLTHCGRCDASHDQVSAETACWNPEA